MFKTRLFSVADGFPVPCGRPAVGVNKTERKLHLVFLYCFFACLLSGSVLGATQTSLVTDAVIADSTTDGSIGSQFSVSFPGQFKVSSGIQEDLLARMDNVDWVHSYIHVDKSSLKRFFSTVQNYNVFVELFDEKSGLIQAWVPQELLVEISQLPSVQRVSCPDYTIAQTGAVTSEGDVALRANELRQLGYTGEGINVGVISIGIDNLGKSQSGSELPEVMVINSTPGTGDEGTALLEIVHDLAPEANLAFCEARTTLEIVNCIKDLRNILRSDIIVDDLFSFGEPFFEDGPVAQAVKEAVSAGIFYASSAGNSAGRHYEKDFVTTDISSYALHDFGVANGSAADTDMEIEVAAGATVLVVLQWNDRFGASDNDYDLVLLDAYGSIIAVSAVTQDGDDDPFEGVSITNLDDTTGTARILIEKYRGQPRRLEMYLWTLRGSDLKILEYNVPSGSIFGHAAVPGVLAVGAIDVSDPGLDTIEPFSSLGPAEIFYPIHELRKKPDLVATDGVSISSASGFYSPFFGTSAAVPHVAGIAALLMDAYPQASAKQVSMALRVSALDLGEPGFDSVFGAGLVDTMAAEAELFVPDVEVPHIGGIGAFLMSTKSAKSGVTRKVGSGLVIKHHSSND